MNHRNRLLLYGALGICAAVFAVPQLTAPTSFSLFSSAESDAVPEDDGTFQRGFGFVDAQGSSTPGGARSPSTLLGQLDQTLERLERSERSVPAGGGERRPEPVQLRAEPTGDNTVAMSRARDEQVQRMREGLTAFLQRHPPRGALLKDRSQLLLLDGLRLTPGELVGSTGWRLDGVDRAGATFSQANQRMRVDFSRSVAGEPSQPSSLPDGSRSTEPGGPSADRSADSDATPPSPLPGHTPRFEENLR